MNPRELLMSGASDLGVSLAVDQVNSLFIYAAELRKWNRRINLTSITDEREVLIKHFLDSLAYLKGFTPAPGLRLLDMGSGAGFPGLPLAVARPGLRVTLVESVKKKASFLRHIIRVLGLGQVDVKDVRVQELPGNERGNYDVVTARAFADIGTAVATGAEFLKAGAVMVLSRGEKETEEERSLTRQGVSLEQKIELTLPHSNYRRTLWVLRKQGQAATTEAAEKAV